MVRKIDRMNSIIKTTLVLAVGIAVFSYHSSTFAGKMIQVFINNEEVIAYGVKIMRRDFFTLLAAQFLLSCLQALGKGLPLCWH